MLRDVLHRLRTRTPAWTKYRPRVEALEDRAVPCTLNWTNAAGGLWHAPGNWDLSRLPGADDDVCVPDFAGNIAVTHSQGTDAVRSVTAAEGLVVSGGSLAVATDSALLNLTLSNGTLTGAGNVSVGGRFIWTGGAMSGAGTTRLEAGGQLDLTGGAVTLGRNFDNAGTVTVIGPGSALTLASGMVFNNLADALFDIRNDQNVNGSGTFHNRENALLRRGATTGRIRVTPTFNNHGTLEVQTGRLVLSGNGSHTGAFMGLGTAWVEFGGGTHVLQAGAQLTADKVSVQDGASVTVHGSYAVSRRTDVFQGNLTFTPVSSLAGVGEELLVYNGTVDFSSGEDVTVRLATLSGGTSGGTLVGSDRVTVTENLAWYTGWMGGTGTTTILGTLELDPFRTFGLTLARTLNNYGTAVYSSHFGFLTIGAPGGVFNNMPGATFDLISNEPITIGNGVFNNSEGASFRLLVAGEGGIPWVFNNSGLVEVQRGQLNLRGGGSHRGTFVTAPGAVLQLGGGTHDFQSSSTILADRVLVSADTVNFSGAYEVSDETTITGGLVSFNPSSVVSGVGSALTVHGGTVNFNSGEALVPSRLVQTGGTLAGADNLYVLDSLIWSGGAMIGSGLTAAFGEVALSGAGMTLGRVFASFGTATWTGTGDMSASPGALFYNAGTFDVQNDQRFTSSCQALFYNAGTFRKTAGYGTTTLGLVFADAGAVDVQTGAVDFACGAAPGRGHSGGDVVAVLVRHDGDKPRRSLH